jgi:hypothetical protein
MLDQFGLARTIRARVVCGVHATLLRSTSLIALSRVQWAFALPGTVAVIAALARPDLLGDVRPFPPRLHCMH